MIKKVLFIVAVIATTMSYGQIDVTYSSGPTQILSTDGTFNTSVIVTFSDIPDTVTGLTFRSRLYSTGSEITAGGQLVQTDFFDLNENISVDNLTYKTTVTSNEVASTYDVEIEFKSFNNNDGVSLENVDVSFRVFFNGESSTLFDSSTVTAEGTGTSHRNFKFNENVPVVAVLSNDIIDSAEAFIIFPNPTTGIINISDASNISTINVLNVQGQVVRVYEGNTSIDISDLKAGVYFLQADNGLKRKIVKK